MLRADHDRSDGRAKAFRLTRRSAIVLALLACLTGHGASLAQAPPDDPPPATTDSGAGDQNAGQPDEASPNADAEGPPAGRVVEDDLFEAGSSVDLRAEVQGDLFAAGGWVDLGVQVADNLIAAGGVLDAAGRVGGDFIVTGGLLDLVADVGDNLVAAGVIVDVDALIGRKLFASAARLRVGHSALISGDAWFAAGSADVAGTIEGNAVIAGGSVTLRGRIKGNVDATALSLTLAEGTVIGGSLIHRGPEPPDIEEGAVVVGVVEHAYEPKPADEPDADANGGELPPLLWLLIILVLGLVLDLLVPGYVRGAERLIIRHPFASFGLGLAILFTTPVIIVILIVSVLGFALGLAAVAAYGTLLLFGPAVALFALVRLTLGRLSGGPLRPARRRLGFAAMLLAFGLLGWVPYLGTPLLWLISVLGLGAAAWQIYESLRSSPATEETAPAPDGAPAAR